MTGPTELAGVQHPKQQRAEMSLPTIEQLRQVFDLDAQTGVLRWKVRPNNRVKVGAVAGSPDSGGYLQVRLDGKNLLVHRVVFAMVNGFWPEQVDHANGIKTDNCPVNLRAATIAENNRNARKAANNTSGVKGVTWNKKERKWKAQCKVNRRKHHIGYFTDLEAAAAAARAFREQHHKEFARHD